MTSSVGTGLRFRFVLTPLAQVAPWGAERRLHWFGLTDGWYWIELGEHELLRYAPETLAEHRDGGAAARHPYVDYYVARIWQDLIGLAPAVLEPVPDDLQDFVASDPRDWRPVDDGELDDPDLDAAMAWHDGHEIYLGYLRDAPRIRFWRAGEGESDGVTVSWQHPDAGDSDIRFTAPATGRVRVPADSFAAAVRRLDAELIAAMAQRIGELERAVPVDGVQVDLAQLRGEHDDRSTWLARLLDRRPGTDWDALRRGADRLLAR